MVNSLPSAIFDKTLAGGQRSLQCLTQEVRLPVRHQRIAQHLVIDAMLLSRDLDESKLFR
jgi:hypothetical protein